MGTEKQKSEVRKEQIARAALALIASQGMKGLSVASVARRIGLVPSALYRHFKGKEEILEATIALVRDLLMENIRAVGQESALPLVQLRLLLMRHVRMVREFEAIPRIVFSEEIQSSLPRKREVFYTILQGFLGQVAELIRLGQRLGQINPGVNPETISILFLGLIQPPVVLWHLSNGKFDITKHAEKAWEIFEKAIRIEEPSSLSLRKKSPTKRK